jgi:hypothetical protein
MKLTDIIHQIGDRVRIFSRLTALTGGLNAVDSVVVTNGGTGYTSAPTVAFTGGGGSGAAATAIVAGGKVVRIDVTNPGTGYTSVPAVGFTLGGGSGAAATAVILATTLDAILTPGLSLLQPLFGIFLVGNDLTLYRLRSGTDAELSPFIIRPDDYAGTTNEKVWEMLNLTFKKLKNVTKSITFASTTDLNMDDADHQSVDLTGNVTFTTSNRADGKEKIVKVKCDGTLRTLTFPAWIFVGTTAPANIAINKTAILSLRCYGANDTDVVASWAVQP